MHVRLVIAAAVLAVVGSIPASNAAQSSISEALKTATHPMLVPGNSTWSSWGGEAEFTFNPDRLVQLGVRIESLQNATELQKGAPGLRDEIIKIQGMNAGALDFAVDGKKLQGLRGGSLQYSGGFVLAFDGGKADLRGLRIRPTGISRFGLEVVDGSGNVWMTLDHAHFNLIDNDKVFRLRDMNSRVSPYFAQRLGHPEWADLDLGGLNTYSNVYKRVISTEGLQTPQTDCSNNWPGVGSPPYYADIQTYYGIDTWTGHVDGISVRRCNINTTGACTTTSTTGQVVIDQDSTLRNIGTAAVTWHPMFSGIFPPYNNDQHPMLIWNLYRLDSSGNLKQIGVSGIKHAFETVNYNCSCADGVVIYPTCEDTYSTSNNDGSSFLGPRNELIARTAQWGRCGSVFDSNCDGNQGPNPIGAQNNHQYRLNAVESDMLPPLSTGAHYYFEYWYVVRDDINIYNTMGFREIVPAKNGANWSTPLTALPDFTEGPYVNSWVSPTSPPAGAMNQELNSSEGLARVAVKTTDLGGGVFHYQYSVMNLNFARAMIDPLHPTEPNMKVLSNTGFGVFGVQVPIAATISNIQFNDTDLDGGNDWTSSNADGVLSWHAPAGNELNWGTMYTFSFDADSAPVSSQAVLGVAQSGTPAQYSVDTLAPFSDPVMADGFDAP